MAQIVVRTPEAPGTVSVDTRFPEPCWRRIIIAVAKLRASEKLRTPDIEQWGALQRTLTVGIAVHLSVAVLALLDHPVAALGRPADAIGALRKFVTIPVDTALALANGLAVHTARYAVSRARAHVTTRAVAVPVTLAGYARGFVLIRFMQLREAGTASGTALRGHLGATRPATSVLTIAHLRGWQLRWRCRSDARDVALTGRPLVDGLTGARRRYPLTATRVRRIRPACSTWVRRRCSNRSLGHRRRSITPTAVQKEPDRHTHHPELSVAALHPELDTPIRQRLQVQPPDDFASRFTSRSAAELVKFFMTIGRASARALA